MAKKAHSRGNLEVKSVHRVDKIDKLKEDWKRLSHLQRPGFFMSFEWMSLWMKHFGDKPPVEILTVEEENCVQLIAPLRFRRAKSAPVSIRIAETVGTRHLPYNDLIYERARLEEWLEDLLDYLVTKRRIHILRLTAVREESPLTALLLTRRGRLKDAVACQNISCRNRYAQIGDDYQIYYRERSSKLRSIGRYDLSRLLKMGPVSTRLHVSLGGATNVIDEYFALYSRSWQERESHEPFVREVLLVLSSLGMLRLFYLDLNRQSIAAQLVALDGQKAYILKNFYDLKYHKYSLGTILSFDAFNYLIEKEHVREIDYMKGDQDYKARWLSDVRRRFDWTIPLTPTGKIASTFQRLTQKLKTPG